MIDLAVMTVDRPKNYVHKLIRRLRWKFPIRLIVGSPSYEYLRRYRKNTGIQVIGVDAGEWKRVENQSTRYKAGWNYWRSLVYGSPRGQGLLILEDDVLPVDGWEEEMTKAIDQIECEYGHQFLLSLYTAFTELPRPKRGRCYTRYPAFSFFGTQAVYYSEPTRIAFTDYLRREGIESYRNSSGGYHDLLLAEYLKITGIPLFVTTPCLFQHIGEVGTGCGPYFHRARYMKKSSIKK